MRILFLHGAEQQPEKSSFKTPISKFWAHSYNMVADFRNDSLVGYQKVYVLDLNVLLVMGTIL